LDVGGRVGFLVGGNDVGAAVGYKVDGLLLGIEDGFDVGLADGYLLGILEGWLGKTLGELDAAKEVDGARDAIKLGLVDIDDDGITLGENDGSQEGELL
jgi:hypothetical protein